MMDAYLRLLAARRDVSPAEREEIEREQRRDSRAREMRRKLPKVY